MRSTLFVHLVVVSVFTLACTLTHNLLSHPSPEETSPDEEGLFIESSRSFENDELILAIPEGWKAGHKIFGRKYTITRDSEFDADVIYTIGIPRLGRSRMIPYCQVFRRDQVDGETLQQTMESAYAYVHENYPEYEFTLQDIKVNSLSAVEKIYQRPWGEPWYKIRDVWLDHAEKYYILSCRAYPDDFDDEMETFESILDGFELK